MRKGVQKEQKLFSSPCLAASAEPRLQTLLMCSIRGLGFPSSESSVHAGRTILEEAPFVGLVRSASWGVLAAAFVAASAERLHSACPGSSLLTMSWLTYSGSLGKKSSTGGSFELKETKVRAGVGVGVEILSSGVFVSCESSLDRIVVEPCRDPGCFANGTNISTRFPLWRLQPKFKGCTTAWLQGINMSCQQ